MTKVGSGADAPRPTRVVAVTRHASLSVTLAYIERTEPWEVVTVTDVDGALAAEAEVAVVALETVEASCEAVSRLRGSTTSPACIVITDHELPDGEGGKPDAVLLRPFTLEELTRSVEALAPARVPAPADPQVVPTPEIPPSRPVQRPRVPKPAPDRPVRPAGPPPAWEWSFDPRDTAPVKPVRLPEAPARRPAASISPPAKRASRRVPAPVDRAWPTEGPLARRARPLV